MTLPPQDPIRMVQTRISLTGNRLNSPTVQQPRQGYPPQYGSAVPAAEEEAKMAVDQGGHGDGTGEDRDGDRQ